jgi:hypothetical protein
MPANLVPDEETIVTTGTPEAGPVARQVPAAAAAPAPRRLGLVLAVIATAQLMVVLDLTIVIVACRISSKTSVSPGRTSSGS